MGSSAEGANLFRAGAGQVEVRQGTRQEAALLEKVLHAYAAERSVSLPVETARDIACSVRYVLQAEAPGGPADAGARYERGLRRIRNEVGRAQALWQAARRGCPPFATRALRDTLEGIGGFFAGYSPEYGAHKVPGSIDYQLAAGCMELEGVFFIVSYLRRLCTEQQFCAFFAPAEVGELLLRYRGAAGMPFDESMENLFDVVFSHALACMAAAAPPGRLLPEAQDVHRVQHRLARMSCAQRAAGMRELARQLCRAAGGGPALWEYAVQYLAVLGPHVDAAVDNGSLGALCWGGMPAEETQADLRQPCSLPGAALRRLLADIARCETPEQKAACILCAPRSLEDMLAILHAGCLQDDECGTLFSRMGRSDCRLLLQAVQGALAPHLHETPAWVPALRRAALGEKAGAVGAGGV